MCSGSFERTGARSDSLFSRSVPPHPGVSPEGASALPAHSRARFTPGPPSLRRGKRDVTAIVSCAGARRGLRGSRALPSCRGEELGACPRKGHRPRGRHTLQEGQRETEVLTAEVCAPCAGSLETTAVGRLEFWRGVGSGCELLRQQQQN